MEAIAAARHRTGAAPLDSRAEAIAEMLDLAQCPFRIRPLGQKTGLIISWGGREYRFMRRLARVGPLILPPIARMEHASRRRMRRLADELAAEGLVDLLKDAKHPRWKLVRLSRKGDACYRKLDARFLARASTMGVGLSQGAIRKTAEIVRRLSGDLERDDSRYVYNLHLRSGWRIRLEGGLGVTRRGSGRRPGRFMQRPFVGDA